MIGWICILRCAFYPDDDTLVWLWPRSVLYNPLLLRSSQRNKNRSSSIPACSWSGAHHGHILTVDVNGRVICKPCIGRAPARVATHVGDRTLSLNSLVPQGAFPTAGSLGLPPPSTISGFSRCPLPKHVPSPRPSSKYPRLASNMRPFLSILCVLAATASTEAFWVMKTSELPL